MELSPFEVHYIVDSVAANVRPDGRHNLQYRPFTLQLSVFPNTFGSARLYYPSDGNQIYASIKVCPQNDKVPRPIGRNRQAAPRCSG